MTIPLLRFEDLTLALPSGADRANAVSDINFEVKAGEIVCVVGESGSGKSVCAQALMGLLPNTIHALHGKILFEGANLLEQTADEWRATRGRKISMIFQEPMTALNPVMRIGDQIAESYEAHGLLRPAERQARTLELAREVGLPDPDRIVRAFPHQLSGGQRQRAMIAMALALEPSLLVADEPTTALDVTTQAQILRLIRDLQRRRGMAVVFITHDFGVVADIADRVVVLEKGHIVEFGTADAILRSPKHPYTRALLAAVPSMKPPDRPPHSGSPVACQVLGLSKTYVSKGGLFSSARVVSAARDVSFTIHRGETLGLVGEFGIGKSTVARLVTRLLDPDSGAIQLGTLDLGKATGSELRNARRKIQMVFQDPFASLNPRRRIGLSIADGPIAAGVPAREAFRKAGDLLETVGLDRKAADRYPHEFSGGQRQRIGIARALALSRMFLSLTSPSLLWTSQYKSRCSICWSN